MHILIKQAMSGSSSGSDNNQSAETETSAAALLVITQSNRATKRDESDDEVVTGEIVHPPAKNPHVDTTEKPPAYPHKEGKATVPDASAHNWDQNNKAKLEVQDLLQMLQRAAC